MLGPSKSEHILFWKVNYDRSNWYFETQKVFGKISICQTLFAI